MTNFIVLFYRPLNVSDLFAFYSAGGNWFHMVSLAARHFFLSL